MTIESILEKIDNLIWGPPLLILLVGTGIYLTIRLKLLQVLKLPIALKYVFGKDDEKDDANAEGDVSSFGALCTALSATIGTGNIVGVATAIKTGGPGALFWMWIAAFFGMATKYAEGVLAIKYRKIDENGNMSGGPMYYIERGLGIKWLAKLFAIFGIGVALFGIGTFGQVNSISDAASIVFSGISPQTVKVICSIVIAALVGLVIFGGIKRISSVSEKVVPIMAGLYILAAVVVLILNINAIPNAVSIILESAFNPSAAMGGATGITVQIAISKGVGRGVFSNEAGLGSAPIAAAAAKTKSPVKQGLISMTGTFFDTIIICTMTGLAIVITGTYTGIEEGAKLTTEAFAVGLDVPLIAKYVINIGLMFFAFTTILGWNYYGERCIEYLAGIKSILIYRIIYIASVALGPFLSLDLIFTIADIVNALMAIPNLIGIIGLRKVIIYETEKFFKDIKSKKEIVV